MLKEQFITCNLKDIFKDVINVAYVESVLSKYNILCNYFTRQHYLNFNLVNLPCTLLDLNIY